MKHCEKYFKNFECRARQCEYTSLYNAHHKPNLNPFMCLTSWFCVRLKEAWTQSNTICIHHLFIATQRRITWGRQFCYRIVTILKTGASALCDSLKTIRFLLSFYLSLTSVFIYSLLSLSQSTFTFKFITHKYNWSLICHDVSVAAHFLLITKWGELETKEAPVLAKMPKSIQNESDANICGTHAKLLAPVCIKKGVKHRHFIRRTGWCDSFHNQHANYQLCSTKPCKWHSPSHSAQSWITHTSPFNHNTIT